MILQFLIYFILGKLQLGGCHGEWGSQLLSSSWDAASPSHCKIQSSNFAENTNFYLQPCVNMAAGNVVDVCCRDPNYQDPWPNMNNNGGGNNGLADNRVNARTGRRTGWLLITWFNKKWIRINMFCLLFDSRGVVERDLFYCHKVHISKHT